MSSRPRRAPLHESASDALPGREGRPPLGHATRERLLDAAEQLFGEHGFEGTSIRAVTEAAGTAVSAANYHFGSKEALLRATLLRRVEPVNRSRLERLDALEAETREPSLPLERVLEAFLRPVFEMLAEQGAGHARFVAARLYSEAPNLVAALKRELFGEVTRRFLDALERALPGVARGELALGLQLLVGAMVHVVSGNLADAPGLDRRARGSLLAEEALLRRFVAFGAAGLRALGKEARS